MPLTTPSTMPPPPPPPPSLPPAYPATSTYHSNDNPDTGPPPRYTAVVRKVYPYSLRPVVFFTAFIGLIYGIALGVESIKDMGNDNETSKMKVFDLVQAILFFIIGGLEVFAIGVAFLQKLSLARFLVWLTPVGILVNAANQILAIVLHFTLKGDLIDQCAKNEVGDLGIDRFGNVGNITQEQAESICNNSWSRGTWSVFAWFFLSVIVSLLFGSILLSFYRQLLDPSSVRTRTNNNQAQGQAFPMQPGYYYPPPPNGGNSQQPWMVPPYPGPPVNGAPPPPGGYEKSDYHPEAGWAQGEYGPPSGAPPPPHGVGAGAGSGFGGGAHRAEEEAWERAQSEGVTAHLTGHAPSPSSRAGGDRAESGYVIRNEEEDEAWETARNEGVTAHLTGAGRGASGTERTREGAI